MNANDAALFATQLAMGFALAACGVFVKPVAATVLAASLFTQLDPLVATILGLVTGGSIASVVHAMKGATRVVSTGTTAGLANPFISFAEDAAATAGIVLAFVIPVVAALAAIAIVAYCFARLARRLRRTGPPPRASAGS